MFTLGFAIGLLVGANFALILFAVIKSKKPF